VAAQSKTGIGKAVSYSGFQFQEGILLEAPLAKA
jgi:hypothetical protein